MKYLFIFFLNIFSVCSSHTAPKQTQAQEVRVADRIEPNNLSLTWGVLEEKYLGKNQTLSVLTFKNEGKAPMPASGWSLYFHSTPSFKPKEGNAEVKVESINGDFLRMSPTSNFKQLAPGATAKIEFVAAGQIVNESRAPRGFYLVWDDNKTKGYTLENYAIIKPAMNQIGWVEPKDIYAQNSSIKDIPAEKLTKIFPSPAQYKETGQAFTLTAAIPVVADNAFQKEAALLAVYLETIFGQKPAVKATGTMGKAIRLQKKAGLGPEAYELTVSPQEIVISATTPAGAFYGTQSLKTLLPASALAKKQTSVAVAGVQVKDAPRFGHRAFMLDVARNFHQKKEVLKLLDLMALYKLNVFHFHLNDDEGWRIEIPGLPELTQVGGRRGHSLDEKNFLQPSYGSGPDVENVTGSGFYTRADFIEILKYARDRHIKVIPEVETPGHARAAIKSMDARYDRLMKEGKKAEAEQYMLRDVNDKSVYRSVQYFNDNVINVALPSTYTFLEKVTDELLSMYKEAGAPIQTIHFGGDEVPNGVWEKSPVVQELMAKNADLKNVDDLWYYFFGKLNTMLKKRNLYLSGWEEVGLRKVRTNGRLSYVANPDFVKDNVHVDVWNNLGSNIDLAYRMANAGYKVVLTNVSHFYMDLAYQKAYDENGLYWGGYLDVDKPFYFIPFDYMQSMRVNEDNKPITSNAAYAGKEQLKPSARTNIVGLQAPLWSEMILSPERLEYMLLPKLLGLAERAWAPDPAWATKPTSTQSKAAYVQDWSEFVNVLGKRELPRLNYYAGGFSYRIPTVGATTQNGKVVANAQLPGMTIRYTTDETVPTVKSKVYSGPISEKGTVKLAAFDVAGRSSRITTVENGQGNLGGE
ncbi:family 20 glycosylhydrolase [Rufibacter tibetensis]|uniref:beta-N-acetylhexosaminidase n=1 Tax=Rufibacter tibetensis TaxID=512763 RepID=A0A0N7HW71_9BACT|nr:family 20 glycosylhydrolase [Rufibacter tibetensis]ALI98432.1 beta-N-acetylhexosaminidase [Rufibacter tibetensis]